MKMISEGNTQSFSDKHEKIIPMWKPTLDSTKLDIPEWLYQNVEVYNLLLP